MRLPESFRFMLLLLLLTLVLVGAELMTGRLCHGRRIPGAEVVVVESPPPPSEGYGLLFSSNYKYKQQRRMSRWRRLQDFSESKREVPSGPNPLHN
ncbi:hypothetical protein SEVIR_9G574601v4 [Setaria viridis]